MTLLGQTIAMIVFVWFCMKLIWPPIIQAIEERQTQIADGLAAAECGGNRSIPLFRAIRLAFRHDLVGAGMTGCCRPRKSMPYRRLP